jgi:hypothetical protein
MKRLVMAIVVGTLGWSVASDAQAPRPQIVEGVYDANHNVTFSAKRHRMRTGHHRSWLLAPTEISAVGHRSSLCARAVGHLSCGCDTASYFGVRRSVYANGKHDLDLASNWRHLRQSPGPCVNCAAWRPGHVMAIVGGGPGGWRVMDFNSGHGITHEYVVAHFRGYRFAHPQDIQLAGRSVRHHRRYAAHTPTGMYATTYAY